MCVEIDFICQFSVKIMWFLTRMSCRYNLDPEGRRSDDEVWEALEIVNMKETIKFMSGQLGSFSV